MCERILFHHPVHYQGIEVIPTCGSKDGSVLVVVVLVVMVIVKVMIMIAMAVVVIDQLSNCINIQHGKSAMIWQYDMSI